MFRTKRHLKDAPVTRCSADIRREKQIDLRKQHLRSVFCPTAADGKMTEEARSVPLGLRGRLRRCRIVGVGAIVCPGVPRVAKTELLMEGRMGGGPNRGGDAGGCAARWVV